MRQDFFLEGRYLGCAPRGLLALAPGQYAAPLSKLFFCGTCGEVFAKCPVSDGSRVMPWHSVYATCRRCPPSSGLHVPGSIWHHEAEFVAAFPDAVLLEEVLRHLDYIESNHGHQP